MARGSDSPLSESAMDSPPATPIVNVAPRARDGERGDRAQADDERSERQRRGCRHRPTNQLPVTGSAWFGTVTAPALERRRSLAWGIWDSGRPPRLSSRRADLARRRRGPAPRRRSRRTASRTARPLRARGSTIQLVLGPSPSPADALGAEPVRRYREQTRSTPSAFFVYAMDEQRIYRDRVAPRPHRGTCNRCLHDAGFLERAKPSRCPPLRTG
jgi:hypothetical protein